MTKIVLINHSFQINYFSRRWELFAQKHQDVDVYLFAPAKMEWYNQKNYSYDDSVKKVITAQTFDKNNYHRRIFRTVTKRSRGWVSPDFEVLINDIRPDIVYHIGTHLMPSITQLIDIKRSKHLNFKLICFSMRGPAFNLQFRTEKFNPIGCIKNAVRYFFAKQTLSKVNKYVDAIFCHYPDAVECFRKEGYKGPLYMQTQVGVNEEWFHNDFKARKEIRDKYSISDSTYVFASATRLTLEKGIDIILKALPVEGDWKYLMMGTGSDNDKKRLRAIIEKRGLQDKVIETGMIDWYEIAKYWNAADCAIHVPLTTPHWEDTFSLSAIQPQITGKPVIGDTSGSIPYQIGFNDMIVPENNVEALAAKIQWVLSHKSEAAEIGEWMYHRVHNCFEIQHLNDLFYDTLIEDILPGSYDAKKHDMAKYGEIETKDVKF